MSDFKNEWLKKYLNKEPKVIFDVGSYHGIESLSFKHLYPECDIYIFEASKSNFNKFFGANRWNNMNTYNIAISDSDGFINFYDSVGPADGSGSILHPTEKLLSDNINMKFDNGNVVKCSRIDTFCIENNIKHIDFMHIDVQGAELYVFKGLGDFMPDLIFAETCEYENYKNSYSLKYLDDFLINLGYKVEKRLFSDTLYIKNNTNT